MDSSYEAGLSGRAQPAGGNFDSWQQGASVHAATTAELARQASAGIPDSTSSWDRVTPNVIETFGGRPSSGQWVGGGPAARGFLGTLAALPSVPFAVFLYPLATVAGAAMLAMAGLFAQQAPLVLLFGGGSIPVFWIVCRFDQRMGEHAGYRTRRHLMRLLIVGAMPVVSALNAAPLPGITDSALLLAVRVATGGVIGLVLMVPAHFILRSTWLRTQWHGALKIVGLRPRTLDVVATEPKVESA